tara:strand:- start:1112 stop:1828 length:717 start_codon:yes stop_codon:yes gene_type:complete
MKNFKKIAIFLAARSGSKRLPNKHFLKLNKNHSVIDLCIKRLKKAKLVKTIILCTTQKKEDHKFKNICKNHQINLFRGNNKNVLKRFVDCAKKNSIETIVRITADCPLIDPKLIDKCIYNHFKKKNDYTTNTLKLSYPDGLDVEVISLKSLIKSLKRSKRIKNKEHVTTFIRASKIFKKYNIKNNKNYSDRRWTLDNNKDYSFLKKVGKFFSRNIYFSWMDLIKAEKVNHHLINIKKR